jgi:hypothetical protein
MHKFDGSLEDIFDLQDQVTASVVGLIAPTVERAEIGRANQKPTDKLDSYDLYSPSFRWHKVAASEL